MTCDGCVKAVSDSLFKLGGITKVDANLKDQLVSVEGTGASRLFYSALALFLLVSFPCDTTRSSGDLENITSVLLCSWSFLSMDCLAVFLTDHVL